MARVAALVACLVAVVGCGESLPDPGETHGASYAAARQAVADRTGAAGRARNVIFFLGDGMSVTTVTAARILEGQQRGEPGEENLLAFEELPQVALLKTYNTNQQVSDSAGTMTAMMSGVMTKAAVLGVDDRVRPGDFASVAASRVPTLLELAEEKGLSTGVVTTTRLTHATPAACYAHSAHRNWEVDAALPPEARAADFPDLARQLVEFPFGDGLEVALGGGRVLFLPQSSLDPEYPDRKGARLDGRDLIEEWLERRPRSAYVWNLEDFRALDPIATDHVLGLFEPSHMQWEADREKDVAGEPSLAEMTEKALAILSRNSRGYVLMVEAGRIDHGHHAGNAYRALVDTIELSHAVRRARELTDPDETLIVVTADHGHTLTMAGYPTRGNPILGLVVPNDRNGEPATEPARDALGLPYTTLGYANGPGYSGASQAQEEGPKHFPHTPRTSSPIRQGRPDLSDVDTGAPDYLQESSVPMAVETHSGEDVPLYAGGPGAELFHGVRNQAYVFHALVAALGWN